MSGTGGSASVLAVDEISNPLKDPGRLGADSGFERLHEKVHVVLKALKMGEFEKCPDSRRKKRLTVVLNRCKPVKGKLDTKQCRGDFAATCRLMLAAENSTSNSGQIWLLARLARVLSDGDRKFNLRRELKTLWKEGVENPEFPLSETSTTESSIGMDIEEVEKSDADDQTPPKATATSRRSSPRLFDQRKLEASFLESIKQKAIEEFIKEAGDVVPILDEIIRKQRTAQGKHYPHVPLSLVMADPKARPHILHYGALKKIPPSAWEDLPEDATEEQCKWHLTATMLLNNLLATKTSMVPNRGRKARYTELGLLLSAAAVSFEMTGPMRAFFEHMGLSLASTSRDHYTVIAKRIDELSTPLKKLSI